MKLKLMLLPLLFSLSQCAMQPAEGISVYGKQLRDAIKHDNQVGVQSLFNQTNGPWMISQLLSIGKLDPNMQGDDKKHALIHWAARANNSDVLGVLFDDPSTQIDIKNVNGCTALGFAVARGNVQVTSSLLQHGANPNAITDEYSESTQKNLHTILHTAVMYHAQSTSKQGDYYKVIGLLLLDSGTEPNKADSSGKTPLHYAAVQGSAKVVELLLKNSKTKSAIQDKEGKTPLDYAHECKKDQIVQLLLAHQKK